MLSANVTAYKRTLSQDLQFSKVSLIMRESNQIRRILKVFNQVMTPAHLVKILRKPARSRYLPKIVFS